MRKVILIITIVFGAYTGVQAQEVNEQKLLGKWKLESINVQGQTVSPLDALGTAEVYQNYKDQYKFKSVFGSEINNGTWKLSKDKRSIIISVQGSPDTVFKVKSFKEKTMSLEITEEGEKLTLNYSKAKSKS